MCPEGGSCFSDVNMHVSWYLLNRSMNLINKLSLNTSKNNMADASQSYRCYGLHLKPTAPERRVWLNIFSAVYTQSDFLVFICSCFWRFYTWKIITITYYQRLLTPLLSYKPLFTYEEVWTSHSHVRRPRIGRPCYDSGLATKLSEFFKSSSYDCNIYLHISYLKSGARAHVIHTYNIIVIIKIHCVIAVLHRWTSSKY